MKRKILGLGLLAAGLILAIALTGCPNGNGDTGDHTQIGEIQVSAGGNAIAFGGTRTLTVARSGGTTEIDWTSSSNAITISPAAGLSVTITAGTTETEDVVITARVRGTDRTQAATFSVVEPQQLQSLSFQGVTADINIPAGSSATTLTLVPYPAGADVGTITWAPLAEGDVWVVPNPNNLLQATVHAGNNVTTAPVQVTATSGTIQASVNVNVIVDTNVLSLVITQIGSAPDGASASLVPNADGRIVIRHNATSGGWDNASGPLQNNHTTFVHLSLPSEADPVAEAFTQDRWTARVRIANVYNANATGAGVLVGMFDNPADMAGSNPTNPERIRWTAMRFATNNTMSIFFNTANVANMVGGAGQFIPAMNQPNAIPEFATPVGSGGAHPGNEFLITVRRDEYGGYTFEARDRFGNHPVTGESGGYAVRLEETPMLPSYAFFGFAVAGATVEISNVRVYSGDNLIASFADAAQPRPLVDATNVTLSAGAEVPVGDDLVLTASIAPVGPDGAMPPTVAEWQVEQGYNDSAGAITFTAAATGITLTGVEEGYVRVRARAVAGASVWSDWRVVEVTEAGDGLQLPASWRFNAAGFEAAGVGLGITITQGTRFNFGGLGIFRVNGNVLGVEVPMGQTASPFPDGGGDGDVTGMIQSGGAQNPWLDIQNLPPGEDVVITAIFGAHNNDEAATATMTVHHDGTAVAWTHNVLAYVVRSGTFTVPASGTITIQATGQVRLFGLDVALADN